MLRVSQMRGAQSGGGAVQLLRRNQAGQVVRKCVNPKRGNLAKRLCRLLSSAAGAGASVDGSFLAQAHVRYATAGRTSAHEAHPFCYADASLRGSRRILRWVGGRASIVTRPIETTLTHNGDMDGLRLRGVMLPYPDLGSFLERVLGVPSRWTGDSPLLAGALELFVTQGMWLESLRLAYQLVVAPEPPDLASRLAGSEGNRRHEAARRVLASHPAPTRATLERWAVVAEAVWLGRSASNGAPPAPTRLGSFRETLAERLAGELELMASPELSADQATRFANAAVEAFLDNDLYVAVRKLEPMLEGTFGCVVTSTLEPGCAVALARGQPLSVGFHRQSGTVGIVSERAALKVRDANGEPAFDERLDLDLCRGEVLRIEVDAQRSIRLTLFNSAEDREYARQELEALGRMLPLRDNPYVTPLPAEPADRAAADFDDLGPLLQAIRRDWASEGSSNTLTAGAFARALLDTKSPRLLVIGVTNDLWLAEQFVSNLKLLFPGIHAEAKSSNDVLKETAHSPLPEDMVILAVSQSGQDFPTLGALLSLQARPVEAGNQSFFVMAGEIDTLMGEAVGQNYARGAPPSCRVFCTGSGFRPSEAPTLTVNATHQSLVELLLFLAERTLDRGRESATHGFRLTRAELSALKQRLAVTVDRQVPLIAGDSWSDRSKEPGRALSRRARRWSWHVLEGAIAFVAVVLLLELNLALDLGVQPSNLLTFIVGAMPGFATVSGLVEEFGKQANVAFYALLAPLFVWMLRALQGRSVLHRQGTRELLIGDTRYVHRVAWFLAKKLFSLSYGFASIKPYSADNQDELILTHEPLRGSLAIFGISGAGRQHLGAREAAARMTAKQFASSRSLGGAGAEVLTIGHGPAPLAEGLGSHIVLEPVAVENPSPLLDALLEDMFDSWERLLALQVFLSRLAERVARFRPFAYDRSRTKDQVFAATTAAPVSAAALYQLLAQSRERLAASQQLAPSTGGVYSEPRPDAPRVRTLIWGTDTKRPPSAAA